MAATGHFQLFPPHARTTDSAVESNPFRRPKSKSGPEPGASFPLQELVKSSNTESVIIQIVEEPQKIESPPRARITPPKMSPPKPQSQAETPRDTHRQSTEKPIIPKNLPPPPPRPSSFYASALQSSSGSSGSLPTPAKSDSPVVTMKSMFPTFNHQLPLNQQRYYPQRQASLPTQLASRGEYNPRVASPTPLDEVLGGPKTAPSSVINFPMDDFSIRGPQFSSPRELDKLWEATNGQDPQTVLPGFDLQMSRTDMATFSFGSTPSQPFYTLQTYDTNELSIHRTNPRKPTVKIPILMLALENDSRRLPPNDGLVTYIFPKLAAMLAMDQSTELANQHGLAPTHRDEMQAEAVSRAAAQESCQLTWNEVGQRYELAHPAIGRDPEKTPPQSPSSSGYPQPATPALHISVSSHALTSPQSPRAAPPVIIVTNPQRNSQDLASPANRRASTLQVHESSEPLASLDLGTMTLHISARFILQLMPSLYAIDCIVAAIMAVAVADDSTNPILAELDIWKGQTMSPGRAGSVFGGASVGGRSFAGSTLYATLAEREEAEDEAKLMKQLHDKDVSAKAKAQQKRGFWGGNPKEKKPQKTKKITVAEIDLEKLTHYQGGEREGQELPGVTRSALKGMVVLLQFLIWALTALVRFLAWALVTVTRTVTSEKF